MEEKVRQWIGFIVLGKHFTYVKKWTNCSHSNALKVLVGMLLVFLELTQIKPQKDFNRVTDSQVEFLSI